MQPQEDEPLAQPDVGEDDWARLGAALAESSAALAGESRVTLASALGSLADAARRLRTHWAATRNRTRSASCAGP
jgi:hypothetical protein